MKKLTKGKTMTLKEVAENTGAAHNKLEKGICPKCLGIKVYEGLHPETKAGVAGGKASGMARGTTADSAVVQRSFANDTAIDELKTENQTLANNLQATKKTLDYLAEGYERTQRIAEAGGCMLTDQDDLVSAYRGRA